LSAERLDQVAHAVVGPELGVEGGDDLLGRPEVEFGGEFGAQVTFDLGEHAVESKITSPTSPAMSGISRVRQPPTTSRSGAGHDRLVRLDPPFA